MRLSFIRDNIWVIVFLIVMLAIYSLGSGIACKFLEDYAVTSYPDATSYFIQAKIFAEGHLNIPSPEPEKFFRTTYCLSNGRFYGMYSPGWPAVLSLGILFKVPWLVSPIMMVLSLAAIFLMGCRIYDRNMAWMGMIITAFLPMSWWAVASYFSEPMTLLFATLWVLAIVQSLKTESLLMSILGGLFLGIVFLVRPYTAAAIAVPVVIYCIPYLKQTPRLRFHAAMAFAFFALIAIVHLFYNYYQTGSALTFPISVYNPNNKLGFGYRSPDIERPIYWFGLGHAIIRFFSNSLFNFNMRSLVLILIFFIAIRRYRRFDGLLLLCVAGIIGFHFFYFHNGARHWFPAMFAWSLLGARGIAEIARILHLRFSRYSEHTLQRILLLFTIAPGFLVFSWTTPAMILERNRLLDPYLQVSQQKITDAIVFLNSTPHHYEKAVGYYIQNLPGLDENKVFFVRDLGDQNYQLINRYPTLKPYQYRFDRITGQGRLYPFDITHPEK